MGAPQVENKVKFYDHGHFYILLIVIENSRSQELTFRLDCHQIDQVPPIEELRHHLEEASII
jgi:hypothetical protein